jgi:hypothetical protein
MFKNCLYYLVAAMVMIIALNGCATAPSTSSAQHVVKSFKDYPDHTFNPKEYVARMEKGGHNLLIWQDPAVDLKKYNSIKIANVEERLLPAQDRFSYVPFIKKFNLSFQTALPVAKDDSESALLIEIAMVECNPGSRAARILVGFGAGKSAGAVVCEVYEPDTSRPCVRIYARDTGSMGMFGGDSVNFLNLIFEQVAIRLSTVLEARIGQ